MITTKERPILFNAPMVRAILAGDKTQTRRIMKAPCQELAERDDGRLWPWSDHPDKADDFWHPCPYGQVGDRLWVRENWQYADWTEEGEPHIGYAADGKRVLFEDFPDEWSGRLEEIWTELSAPANYGIDNRAADRRWRPNIHMPRWACRILLEVTGVRVERLQDISEQDALAEGIEKNWTGDPSKGQNGFGTVGWMLDCGWINYMEDMDGEPAYTPQDSFRSLWQSINGRASWEANPWVWVIEFRRAK